jgi:hypothetical protein
VGNLRIKSKGDIIVSHKMTVEQELKLSTATLPENLSEKRKGGVLAIGSRDASWSPIIRQIGGIGRRKVDKYATYALAKADGLIKYKEVSFKNGWVISFSGFAPNIDEAVVLAIGIKLGFTTEQKADKLAIKLGNERWKEVKDRLLAEEILS